MFGRNIGLFVICHVLLPAVKVSGKKCQYVVELQTGYKYRSGTDDDVFIQIREGGPWHNLDNPDADDFERGHTDAFEFKDECIDSQQQTTIGTAGHKTFFRCAIDKWLLIYVKLMPQDSHWINEWATDKWFSCMTKLKLPRK